MPFLVERQIWRNKKRKSTRSHSRTFLPTKRGISVSYEFSINLVAYTLPSLAASCTHPRIVIEAPIHSVGLAPL